MESGNARVCGSDQPGAFARTAAIRSFIEQVVQCLSGVAALIESRPVHCLDLALSHPHGVSIVAYGRAEVVVAVDQMRAIDARGNLHDDGALTFASETMHIQAKHRR